MVVKDYAIDMHWSSIILGLSEVLCSVICFFIINVMKRKSVLYFAQIGGLLVSIPIFLYASCSTSVDVCGSTKSYLQISGLFCYRFFASLTYNFFCVYQHELFPIQIKAIAIQFICLSGASVFIISPILQKWLENMGISITVTFWLTNILMILIILGIP
jgi:hypothetical protein